MLSLAAGSLSRCLVLTDQSKPDNPIAYVNSGFTVMTGYERHEVVGQNLRILQGPETDSAVIEDFRQAVSSGTSIRRDILNYRKNGDAYWNDVSIDPVRTSEGRLIGFAATMVESTALHIAQVERQAALDRLELITRNVPGYIFQRILKRDGSINYSYLSPSLFRILGLPEDTDWTAGQNFAWFHDGDRKEFIRLTKQSADEMKPLFCDIRVLSVTGEECWFRTDSSPRKLPNGDTVWEGLALDVTSERTAKAKLEFIRHHDILTGVSNRLFFKNAVIEALSQPFEVYGRTAIFYIDLCSFSGVNGSRGEVFADKVLRRIALRLTEWLQTRAGSVSRVGGADFGLIVSDMHPNTNALETGKLICAEISRPMIIDGSKIVIEACVGVADFSLYMGEIPPGAEEQGAELMKRMHLAVNAAKRIGAGTSVLYSPLLDDRTADQTVLTNALREAVEDEQFELHYQPIVDLRTGHIIGAEALVRWSHPELGLVRPDYFIPLAESTRLIVPLGNWINKAVMRQAQSWRHLGVTVPRLSINLSAVQLQSPSLVAIVEDALAETGCNAADFEFELTEGMLIDQSPEVSARLSRLKEIGFSLALDDFGSGHATFAYLRQFPVDKIKIDQIFIRHMVAGSNDEMIVKGMITLARSLGLKVLAEGVETQRQRNFLLQEGCENAQGFLFSPPLKADDFARMLTRRVSLPLTKARGRML